ncbi:MAG: aconitate hydratase AcnA [Candidatus Limnocylindria bacterium]|nr:aconitate hydratase AcnA [Candidatus Limnocylindria bacterium]
MTSTLTPLPGTTLRYHRLDALREAGIGDPSKLPFTVKILLENLLREQLAGRATDLDIRALVAWPATTEGAQLPFTPARVLLQDFTGVPAVVDLAAMRAAMQRAGKDPRKIDPLVQVDLVVDHSVQVDFFGSGEAYARNLDREFERNGERYALFRWAQQAFNNFRVVPPGMGICHQVNLERLSRLVQVRDGVAIYDTLVGADSHTTMVNGLGIFGWGVGGIEAEAAMLGQPMYLPAPVVIGVRLSGSLRPGTTATDLVLTLTERFRKHGVVDKFVEFCGAGLSSLSVPDRATLSNMCPDYGATAALFPADERSLEFLEATGRGDVVPLARAYLTAQGLFRTDASPTPVFSELIEFDLGTVEPSLAGPKRPQDRVDLAGVRGSFEEAAGPRSGSATTATTAVIAATATAAAAKATVTNGSVVLAAITSCTNTSNPSVMVAAGLLAKRAVERGLRVPATVKPSLAPGSRVVTRYLDAAGLTPYLEALGFNVVGYGCTTCIGNSGPLASAEVEAAVTGGDLNVVAVLSGNRNFEGRVHPLVRSSYLASPPLVVAYALAGTVLTDLTTEPLGTGTDGAPVYLKDLWPTPDEVAATIAASVRREQFEEEYGRAFTGDEHWQAMKAPVGPLYTWDASSTYVQEPPFFRDLGPTPGPVLDIVGARALVVVGDSITTDHISPAGGFSEQSPAGRYLTARGVAKADFNQYGTRRGDHEVLMRGTFANIRLRNKLTPEREGAWTVHLPDGAEMSPYDAAMQYRAEGTPLIVIAGKEYGTGSSRDWAAKGPSLLGVRAVIAESFERIHRSNLVGMGVLPCELLPGETPATLGLSGRERFAIRGLAATGVRPKQLLDVEAERTDGTKVTFRVRSRIDNPTDVEYLRHGGVLQMVVRQLLA